MAGVSEVTDSEGRWIEDEHAITLYAICEKEAYTVVLDANVPEGASSRVTGEMQAVRSLMDSGVSLPDMYGNQNAYKLPGYYFECWNTEPDGSGVSYSNGAGFDPVYKVAGATYTLYVKRDSAQVQHKL